jgi:signal transduction histidine kinase
LAAHLTRVPLLHVRAFNNSPAFPELMSQSQPPSDTNEMARLRALVDDYETKLTSAAALVAHVRHEINNPLAALLGQAQLMLREELGDKARKRVETIEKLAIRIKETVGELRDVQTPVAAVNRAEE